MKAIEKFRMVANSDKLRGWPLVGEYKLGAVIPYFGQVLEYTLRTGNGEESYVSLLRHFGWCVVFGVNADNKVITLAQWKPGVNQASWELPPGGIGKLSPGASMGQILEQTKEIYLRETGYGGGEWEYLGETLVETGKYRGASPECHGLPAHMMLATNLVKKRDARHPNRNELIETIEVPIDEFPEVIASGLFKEVSALPCALLALMKLGKLQWSK